ncbi:hypothetical protein [Citrobacter koseri]|uniref:hypothetical protein n=1 Tax=Citrobacter koseri TaxID=545 RepID=UPI0028BDD646|nr:hypothetical protein [Citrobacter koseri]MDT7487288.1 hypothetical protein [Citrobacter koseri]
MKIPNGISSSASLTSCASTLSRAEVSEDFTEKFEEIKNQVAEDNRRNEAVLRGEILVDNSPENAVQNVMKNGEIVATIYKSGIVTIFEPFSGQLANLDLPKDHSSQLGAVRAAMIAEAVGGEIQDINSTSSLYSPFSASTDSVNNINTSVLSGTTQKESLVANWNERIWDTPSSIYSNLSSFSPSIRKIG